MNLRIVMVLASLAAASPSLAQQSDYQRADAELNRLYKTLSSRLTDNPDAKQKFVRAQRAWIAFRDAECGFAASGVEGGSIYPAVHEACLAKLTQERSYDFDTYLSCEEGDMSCPVPSN